MCMFVLFGLIVCVGVVFICVVCFLSRGS